MISNVPFFKAGAAKNDYVRELPTGSADMNGLSPQARAVLERIQALKMEGLSVNSGYRDPARNARAGGAKGSQHMHGNAIDFNIAKLSPEQRTTVLNEAIAAGGRGIGIYPSGNSLHVDTRGGAPVAWGPSPAGAYKGVHDPNAFPSWAKAGISQLYNAPALPAPTQIANAPAVAETGTPQQPMPQQAQAPAAAPPALQGGDSIGGKVMGFFGASPETIDKTAGFMTGDKFGGAMKGAGILAQALGGGGGETKAPQLAPVVHDDNTINPQLLELLKRRRTMGA